MQGLDLKGHTRLSRSLYIRTHACVGLAQVFAETLSYRTLGLAHILAAVVSIGDEVQGVVCPDQQQPITCAS